MRTAAIGKSSLEISIERTDLTGSSSRELRVCRRNQHQFFLPQPVLLAANGDDHLGKVPLVAKPADFSPMDFVRKLTAELLHPETHERI